MDIGKSIISVFGLLLLLGLANSAICNEESALNKSQIKLSKMPNDSTKVELLIKLSNQSEWSDKNASEYYAKEALEISQKLNYKRGLAYSKHRLAKLFQHYEFDLSESLIFESLEYAKDNRDSILLAKVYNVLGNLNFNLGQGEEAFSCYQKSAGIFIRHQQDSSAAYIYSNIAAVQDIMSVDTSSIKYYLKAAEINKQTNNFLGLAIVYINMVDNLIGYGKLNDAFVYSQKCLTIIEENHLSRLYSYYYNNMSFYHEKKKDYQKSLEYADKALSFSRKYSNRLQELDALVTLKRIHYLLSDINMAYQYSEKINSVKDTINNHNRLKELDLLELRFEFAEHQKAQELESARIEADYYKKELIYVYIILGSGLIIISLVFLYFTQRNRTHRRNLEKKTILLEKEQLKKDLEHKSKELTTNVMYLLKKNKFISEVSSKLKKSSFELSEKNRDGIERIATDLDKSISEDNWEDFEVRFQEVHVDFYNKLSKDFPTLTPNELRLCAFLKLNMTSKEISEITFQSLISLKSARYRLRKKLNLEREDNLIAFLTAY